MQNTAMPEATKIHVSDLTPWSDVALSPMLMESAEESLHHPSMDLNAAIYLWYGNLLELQTDTIISALGQSQSAQTLLNAFDAQLAQDLDNFTSLAQPGKPHIFRTYHALGWHTRSVIWLNLPTLCINPESTTSLYGIRRSIQSSLHESLSLASQTQFKTMVITTIQSDLSESLESITHTTLRTVRQFMADFPGTFDAVVFHCANQTEYESTLAILPLYFPHPLPINPSLNEKSIERHVFQLENQVESPCLDLVAPQSPTPTSNFEHLEVSPLKEPSIHHQALTSARSVSTEEGDDIQWKDISDASDLASHLDHTEEPKDATRLRKRKVVKPLPFLSISLEYKSKSSKDLYSRYLKQASQTDFSDFRDFYNFCHIHVPSNSGAQSLVFVIEKNILKEVPHTHRISWETFLLYFIYFMDPIVRKPYEIIYVPHLSHSSGTHLSLPNQSQMRDMAFILESRFISHLTRIQVIKPLLWLRAFVWRARPVIPRSLWQMIHYVQVPMGLDPASWQVGPEHPQYSHLLLILNALVERGTVSFEDESTSISQKLELALSSSLPRYNPEKNLDDTIPQIDPHSHARINAQHWSTLLEKCIKDIEAIRNSEDITPVSSEFGCMQLVESERLRKACTDELIVERRAHANTASVNAVLIDTLNKVLCSSPFDASKAINECNAVKESAELSALMTTASQFIIANR